MTLKIPVEIATEYEWTPVTMIPLPVKTRVMWLIPDSALSEHHQHSWYTQPALALVHCEGRRKKSTWRIGAEVTKDEDWMWATQPYPTMLGIVTINTDGLISIVNDQEPLYHYLGLLDATEDATSVFYDRYINWKVKNQPAKSPEAE